MNEITIPFHLAIPALLSISALVIIITKRQDLFINQRRKWLWLSLTFFFAFYLLIVGGAAIADTYYQWDLNRYDLDKDGFFGGIELTPEQEAAAQRLTSDVGRNFIFITGLVFSGIISFFVFIMGNAYEKLKRA